ncbi:glycoside hydrolase [Fistulina hepatica ATCC 64428]|uniref:Glycoside hydrolase n=1 Tax=Fistulina hepatica ATCC 64428 TaxID=1128425 RepID=A0A0D7ALM7_9AGAR|nr:glycoside hydrolase [Fistulina hepatica ATCC 64428]
MAAFVYDGIVAVPTTSALVSSTSVSSILMSATVAPSASYTPFPPVGSLGRDFSPSGLEQLWDIVGPVEPPPFTTTVVPQLPILLPSPPPALYPALYAQEPSKILPDYEFPVDFKFGVASAAYQVEGATKNEGKGPTIWDWCSPDVGDLQYYLYEEDVARVAALGFNAHSFSIAWARILPFGVAGSPVNQEGLDHYSNLINYHLAMGMEPIVTLFHWDLPLALQAYYGGFTSSNIVEDFANYAKIVFQSFNGRVKTWLTFNEPAVFCAALATYPFNLTLPPGINSSTAPYQCSYNLHNLFLHHLIVSGVPWRQNSTLDAKAVERHGAFAIGWFSDPVYTTGDWPVVMTDTLPESYLPRFTEQEKQDLYGSADFFAIDAYRTQYITIPPQGIDACATDFSNSLWPSCVQIMYYDPAGWAIGASSDPKTTWLQSTPQYLRESLRAVYSRWPSSKMYLSEYGFAEPFENELSDLWRITEDITRTNYYLTYLAELLLAINEDDLPIAGAFAWSLIDNSEWNSGFSVRFGIQHVNYSTLERTYKRSAISLREFFASHSQQGSL